MRRLDIYGNVAVASAARGGVRSFLVQTPDGRNATRREKGKEGRRRRRRRGFFFRPSTASSILQLQRASPRAAEEEEKTKSSKRFFPLLRVLLATLGFLARMCGHLFSYSVMTSRVQIRTYNTAQESDA